MNLYLVLRYSWHLAPWALLATGGALGTMNWPALFQLGERSTTVLQAGK